VHDPDATRVRGADAPDPDATRMRAPDPDATRVRGADPDATRVRPDPEATRVRPDPDATRVRPVAAPVPIDREPTRVQRTRRLADRTRSDGTTQPLLRDEDDAPAPELPAALLARQPPIALAPGFRLHEYRIERVLGQGGFGITYLATDVHLRAPVAIKEYLPEEIAFRAGDKSVAPNASRHRERYRMGLEMFLAEARTLATFRHPNIVRVVRFFEAHRTAYMVLEYERGQPLRTWWPEHQALGERGLVERLMPLLDGLGVVHEAGFLHRDIKPDNLQVREDDSRFVLLDFGSAAQTVALADQEAVIVTPGFAPIEQYGFGDQGPWTDVYALGATLYWAVTGKKPPDAEARAAGVPMKPALEAGRGRFGEAFLRAIDWALTPSPAGRPRDIGAWREALFADHISSLRLTEVLRRGDQPAPASGRAMNALRTVFTPSAWPLAVKMALAMVATALLPMLATTIYNLETSLDALSANQLASAERIARNTAGRIAQLLNDSMALARVIGTDADFARWLAAPDEAAKPALATKLVRIAQANRDIHLVMVMDAAGTAQIANDPEVMGRNFRFRQYFQEAMAGRPFVTSIVVGAVAGQAGVFFSVPVTDASQTVIGAVVLRIHAASFAAILDEAKHQSALGPFMIDGDGVLVYHPREDLLYRSLTTLPAPALASIRSDQRFRRNEIQSLDMPELAQAMVGAKQPGHVSFVSTVSQADEIAGYAPVPGHHWVVGVSQARAAFERPFQVLYRHLGWSLLLMGLLFTGLALRFARSIVRPIQALTGAAHALKEGDFDRAEVTVRSRDEIGQLARTFNVMIDVLRQRERERDATRPGGDRSGR
jgi:serine/threonine protein kinase/HAMP domain-containing protein